MRSKYSDTASFWPLRTIGAARCNGSFRISAFFFSLGSTTTCPKSVICLDFPDFCRFDLESLNSPDPPPPRRVLHIPQEKLVSSSLTKVHAWQAQPMVVTKCRSPIATRTLSSRYVELDHFFFCNQIRVAYSTHRNTKGRVFARPSRVHQKSAQKPMRARHWDIFFVGGFGHTNSTFPMRKSRRQQKQKTHQHPTPERIVIDHVGLN